VITFALSLLAVFICARVGERLGRWAELVGGVILVLIGLRILLAHLI
jgi:manganese efflux pump family protein